MNGVPLFDLIAVADRLIGAGRKHCQISKISDSVLKRHWHLRQSTAGIPAVGNIGLGILIATLIAAGGWVISRRTGFTVAS